VRGHKRQHIVHQSKAGLVPNPKMFVFLDRMTNTKRFEVKAGPDGKLPVEETISLLAMQCVVRGQTPHDFRVMISAGENLLDRLVPRTNQLIQACMATVLPIPISQRQQEVLRGILQNLSNKEIASKLNIAERTVKFHVSGLLQKFHVPGRVDLMQKAGELLSGERARIDSLSPDLLARATATPSPAVSTLRPELVRMAASERRTVNR
jgi:DNA-binding NarL/FixJ family response regulator